MAQGRKTGGRQRGTPNRTTALLKDAILGAAAAAGSDQLGAGGIQGYCEFLAKDEPKAFAQLLGKVLPMQVTGPDGEGPAIIQIERVIVRPPDQDTEQRGVAMRLEPLGTTGSQLSGSSSRPKEINGFGGQEPLEPLRTTENR
jgi:hypothetical protein